jgi:pimeloyl-ACP methyl ester carboxylesterase
MPSAFPQAQRIPTNGVELEVFTQGNKGKPLVLCHGWPELAYSWRHQMPALAAAGYHVIAPNQRGYGYSAKPDAVEDYDIAHLCSDLTGLLDHFGYDDAVFVGHDWGAIVVWNLAMLHSDRVRGVINLSVPFMERGSTPWTEFWERRLGGNFYIVHFNRQPGVADAAFAANTSRFLRNLYRTNQWQTPAATPTEGMPLISIARAREMPGECLLNDTELSVFVKNFEHSGFTGGINWYRNFDRNWQLLADVEQIVQVPALMLYGDHDTVPKSANLSRFVPNVEICNLDCGHWIQQERPEQVNRAMLDWLGRHYRSSAMS